MERQDKNFKKSGRAHLLLGIVLMFIGLFLIADMADIVPWRMRDFIFTWQALLIGLGLIMISNKENKGTGIILIVIGSFFLMPRIIDLPYYWRSLFWPVMLIIVGLVVIFGARRPGGFGKNCGRQFGQKKNSLSDDYLDDVAIFGGGDRLITSQDFRGGKITNIFGGSKYDMTTARLAEGRQDLEVTFIFGGSKFVIPEGWDVRVDLTPIFGGFSDKRSRTIVEKDKDRTLVITGTCIFGGGEIVNYL